MPRSASLALALACAASCAGDTFSLARYAPVGPSVPVAGLPAGASAITYRPETGRFVIGVDHPASLHELDLSNRVVRSIMLDGFEDLEGIAYHGSNRFWIAEERRARLSSIIWEESAIRRLGMEARTVFTPDGNSGLEGVAIDPDDPASVYAIKEKKPRRILKVSTGSTPPVPVWDMSADTLDLDDVSDLLVLPHGQGFLLLSDENRCIVQTDRKGMRLYHLALDLKQPEGLALHPDGTLVVCGEPDQIQRFRPRITPGSADPIDID